MKNMTIIFIINIWCKNYTSFPFVVIFIHRFDVFLRKSLDKVLYIHDEIY